MDNDDNFNDDDIFREGDYMREDKDNTYREIDIYRNGDYLREGDKDDESTDE